MPRDQLPFNWILYRELAWAQGAGSPVTIAYPLCIPEPDKDQLRDDFSSES
jgi:hypothetical protein